MGKGVSILVLLEAGDHEMLWPGVARTPKSPAGQQPRVPKWKPPFMGKQATTVLYVLTMVVVVVGVDVLFFRDHFWERLMANVGIVLVFGAFYFRFLKHS
jgi:hypothetical protein